MLVVVKPIASPGSSCGCDLLLSFQCDKFEDSEIQFEIVGSEDASVRILDQEEELDVSEELRLGLSSPYEKVNQIQNGENSENSSENSEEVVYNFYADYYLVEYNASISDLRKIVLELGIMNERGWSWFGSCDEPPKKRFKKEYFVGGNGKQK
jgi:hypothetical protein